MPDAQSDALAASDAGPVPCSVEADCDDGNPCTSDTCSAGVCQSNAYREGEVCNDGLACTSDDICVAGECTGGGPTDCSAWSDVCKIGSCDESMGGCIATPRTDGESCDDGFFCTEDDQCSAGTCAGTPRDCSGLDLGCVTGVCNEELAECVTVPVADSTPCEDGLFCTASDSCLDGTCVGGAPPSCDDGLACTTDSCDVGSDQCENPMTPIPGAEGPVGDATCSDGEDNDCDGTADDADGSCVECFADPDCDDGNDCTGDTCDNGMCVYAALDAVPCDDGEFCTIGDSCSQGACIGGGARSCADGSACTVDLCDEVDNVCENPPLGLSAASMVYVGTSSSLDLCLTAGSNARGLIWTELVDDIGLPVAGASVTIGGVVAVESTSSAGTYYAELVASDAPSTEVLSIEATSCGSSALLASSVTVTNEVPNTSRGGTGGCSPSGGNLRVRVLAEETGQPITGASVLVGMAEAPTAFEVNPEALFGGSSAPAGNVASTDADGYVEFFDLGGVLSDSVVITAGTAGRAYFTIADTGASDVVLELPELYPSVAPTVAYDLGTGTGNASNCGDLDVALVTPSLDLDFFSGLDLGGLFTENRCWDTGNGTVGSVALPKNLWAPDQSIGFFCLVPGGLDEGTWALDLPSTATTGENENLSMSYLTVPTSDVINVLDGGGAVVDLLALTSYRRQGFLLDEEVSAPQSGVSINTGYGTYNAANAVQITYSSEPSETDVVGFVVGDYSGQNGSGDLFLIGHEVHEYDEAGSTVSIPNATYSTPMGETNLAAPYRLATLSAMYLDKTAHPTVPASRLEGVSTVLLRQDFGSAGGTAMVSSFMNIASMFFSEPGQLRWDNVTRNGNRPTYSRHELSVRSSRYLPVLSCATENDVRHQDSVQWIIVKPFGLDCGSQECFELPTLPASFARSSSSAQNRSGFDATLGSGTACVDSSTCASGESCVDPDGSGLAGSMCMTGTGSSVDPYQTQIVRWRARIYDFEPAPADWSFDDFQFVDHNDWVTHESSNHQVLP